MKSYTSKELSDPKNAALLEEIILVISSAFEDDPIHTWFFEKYSRKAYIKGLQHYWRMLVYLCLLSDATFQVITKDEAPPPRTIAEEESTKQIHVQVPADATIRSVLTLIPPHGNATFDSYLSYVRAGGLSMPFKSGFKFTARLLGFLPRFEKMHDDIFPDAKTKYDNYHIFILATHQGSQGQGLGKKLLIQCQNDVKQVNDTAAEKAKAEGKPFRPFPLYLEASNFNNKRLYTRVGFQDKTSVTFGKLGDGEDLRKAENGQVIGGRLFELHPFDG